MLNGFHGAVMVRVETFGYRGLDSWSVASLLQILLNAWSVHKKRNLLSRSFASPHQKNFSARRHHFGGALRKVLWQSIRGLFCS